MNNNYPYEIVDYANGTEDAYCISQRIDGAPAFRAFWHPSGWSGSGYVFRDKDLAEAIIRLLEQSRLNSGQASK